MSKLSRSLTTKMRKLIFISSKILHRVSRLPRECFARNSFLLNLPCAFEAFRKYPTSTSQVTIPRNERIFSFKKGKQWQFSKNFFLPPPCLSQPKTHFSLKSQPKLKGFNSKTYLRYVLTSFSLWFLRLRLRFLNF